MTFNRENINAGDYLTILVYNLLQSVRKLGEGRYLVFQNDEATIQCSNIINDWSEHEKVQVLP